jgi:hypothetical protein
MMLYRGIEVTYETIREWCQKFRQQYANQLRRKRPYVTDKWHLDEMVVTIKNNNIICGEPWIQKELYWMSCYNDIGTRWQPRAFFANC